MLNGYQKYQKNKSKTTLIDKAKSEVMMSSLKSNQEKLGKLGSKVLGVGWNPSTDNLNLNFSISLVSKKEKTITTVSKENFLAIGRDLLTPKNLPRITNMTSYCVYKYF